VEISTSRLTAIPAAAALAAFFFFGILGGIGLDTLFGGSPEPTVTV
jgi:hypothetical protein